MSILVILADKKNIAYCNKGKSQKVKKCVKKILVNKKLTEQANCNKSCPEKVYIKHFWSQCWWIKNIAMYRDYSVKFINNKKKF